MGYYIDTPRFRWMVYARNYFGFDHRPLADDWSVPEIVQTVAGFASQPAAASSAGRAESARTPLPEETVSPQTHSRGEVNRIRQPVLGVIVNLPHLNPSSIALYARLLSPGRAGPPLLQVEWLVTDSSVDQIERCDYLLVRTGLDRAEWVAPVERYAEQLIRRNPARFTEVASFPIPLEQAEALVYRCEKD
jgi:hypothetical protein